MTQSCDIIIVNWNAGDQLRECIESLAVHAIDSCDCRIVVVDNGSSDQSLVGLDGLGASLTVHRNTENRGFGAACNQGAGGSSADYLLFLNPDARVAAESIRVPLEYMDRIENSDVGVCGIQLVDENGIVTRSCARIPTPRHFAAKMLGLDRIAGHRFAGHVMDEWDHSRSRDVDHVIGAFYMIRRSLFEQLGGFDERFFVYLEDLDLSARVRQAGARIHYLAEARAYHKGGGASEHIKATRLYYALHSRNLYGFKHFSRSAAVALMAGTLVLEPFARIALAIAQRSPSSVKETLRGYSALWSAWPPWRARTSEKAPQR